ncbi:metallophosphoesterase [Psychrosphaera haliotis]|uniref:metallophosphoesterase n=1 Tax=Psychrosphaera haliotis TaxID=555083 RepID=UPI0031D902FB
MKYDIIGDIHGHGTKLENLLIKMGYKLTSKGYSHPEHTAIFVGDFVDKGVELKEHKKVLDIVMAMVANGNALAVMGNHEFNAIAFHTEVDGKPLRKHSSKNVEQHEAFLNEFPVGSQEAQEVIAFFKSLPLFIELNDFRVVHACWDDKQVEFIKKVLPDNRVTSDFMIQASTKDTPEYLAIETLLKGVEIELPNGLTFNDSYGNTRSELRVNWWDTKAKSLQELSRQPDLDVSHIDIDLKANIPFYPEPSPTCFIGHYWLRGEPKKLSDNVICVDYSVAGGGDLVAYQFESPTKGSFTSW